MNVAHPSWPTYLPPFLAAGALTGARYIFVKSSVAHARHPSHTMDGRRMVSAGAGRPGFRLGVGWQVVQGCWVSSHTAVGAVSLRGRKPNRGKQTVNEKE